MYPSVARSACRAPEPAFLRARVSPSVARAVCVAFEAAVLSWALRVSYPVEENFVMSSTKSAMRTP